MLVTKENFDRIVKLFERCHYLAVDTETYGLRPYHGDRLFAIIIGDSKNRVAYFNFNPDSTDESLTDEHLKALNDRIFNGLNVTTFIFHNAKFDMAMLEASGITLGNDKQIHDTMVCERLLDYNLVGGNFSLAATGERYGFKKDSSVEEWIEDNKAYTVRQFPWRKNPKKDLHYNLVPSYIIVPYGIQDVKVTMGIYKAQKERLKKLIAVKRFNIGAVYDNEMTLIRTVYNMQKIGIKLDVDFCHRAVKHYTEEYAKQCAEFKELTGYDFDTGNILRSIFRSDESNWVYGKPTKVKGEVNPIFDEHTVMRFENSAKHSFIAAKKADSKLKYFQRFLYEVDEHGYVHANFNQHTARTGRFSSSSPNMQNLTKENPDSGEYLVRRAFVCEQDEIMTMIDYDQMEYRLLINYCAAKNIIREINNGLDIHGATAKIANISRDKGKAVNFSCVFGTGNASLAEQLDSTIEFAKGVKAKVFSAAPEILNFIKAVKSAVKANRYVFNWLGRPYFFNDSGEYYKVVNTLIQGGASDVVKVAMNRCDLLLQGTKSNMRSTIHDELVFTIHKDDVKLIPELRNIMERAYPAKYLTLTAGVDVGKTLADKISFDDWDGRFT